MRGRVSGCEKSCAGRRKSFLGHCGRVQGQNRGARVSRAMRGAERRKRQERQGNRRWTPMNADAAAAPPERRRSRVEEAKSRRGGGKRRGRGGGEVGNGCNADYPFGSAQGRLRLAEIPQMLSFAPTGRWRDGEHGWGRRNGKGNGSPQRRYAALSHRRDARATGGVLSGR
jgi:hypothetical protein